MRASGVLLPIFSLPGRYGIGCFGKEARKFVDFLADAKQQYWQILPIGPTSYGDSPYQSYSVFAGNPYFIDLEELMEEGLLYRWECDQSGLDGDTAKIDYGKQYNERWKLLRLAYERAEDSLSSDKEFQKFLAKNDDWLNDYAVFMVLKDLHKGAAFQDWKEEYRLYNEVMVIGAEEALIEKVHFYEYVQYLFDRQWHALKAYANKKGVSIIGDIPIYVAPDSADVWANPDLFQVDSEGFMEAVAGCPPDGFSADGQLWGNPLYRWEYHEETNYKWWLRRIDRCLELYDMIRIDHFRGFDAYYSIPADAETAKTGKWVKGPGMKLFSAIKEKYPDIKVIAEDLGYITETVKQLVADTGFPNMKVLEFAFDSRDSSGAGLYLPHNYDKNCVVYTGTHDNATLAGWFKEIPEAEFKMVQDYLNTDSKHLGDLSWRMIRLAMSSTANYCIIPIQDYLVLGNEARINTPSTSGGNWQWRMKQDALSEELAESIARISTIYERQKEEVLPEEPEDEGVIEDCDQDEGETGKSDN